MQLQRQWRFVALFSNPGESSEDLKGAKCYHKINCVNIVLFSAPKVTIQMLLQASVFHVLKH